jgi:HlyD family secretion protein
MAQVSVMKKKTKGIIIIATAVVAVVAGVLIYTTVSAKKSQAKLNTTYGTDTATIGNISLTVSGSGNLGTSKTFEVKADSHLEILDVLVSEGDAITEGQVLATLDIEAMQDYSDDLLSQINTQQIQIDTTNNVITKLSIKSPVDGWVKNLVLGEDDAIEDAMSEYGYIAVISTEQRELISAEGSGLAVDAAVRVKCENTWYDGTVISEDGKLFVSIDSITRTVGADAVVCDESEAELFTGQIELASFVPIESSNGVITDVKFSEDEAIEQGDTLFSAEQYSTTVKDLYSQLEDLKAEYDALQLLIADGKITASASGVVNNLFISGGMPCEKGASMIMLNSTNDLQATVSVDELDINSIQIGQSVSVTLDSLPNEVFTGEVSRISDLGTASGGITTYDVDVSVEGNENFKLGMTVSCEITAQEAIDAVLIPVDDVLTTNSKSYVMVSVERTEAEKSAIKKLISDGDYTGLAEYMGADATALNIMRLTDSTQLLYAEVRAVETGIENAYFVEIKSGLSVGEKVLAQSTDSGSSEEGFNMQGMGGMGSMGGQMPEGFTPGDFQRPDGA